MTKTLEELDQLLGSLEQRLDSLVQAHPDAGAFRRAFDAHARHIEERAGEHIGHVRARLDGMLGSRGFVDSDDAGTDRTDQGYLSAPPADDSAAL